MPAAQGHLRPGDRGRRPVPHDRRPGSRRCVPPGLVATGSGGEAGAVRCQGSCPGLDPGPPVPLLPRAGRGRHDRGRHPGVSVEEGGPTRSSLATLAWRWGPALAVAAVIFALSAQPGLRMSNDASVDGPVRHLAHVGIYAALTIAILHGLGGLGSGFSGRRATIAIVAATLYGVSDEV